MDEKEITTDTTEFWCPASQALPGRGQYAITLVPIQPAPHGGGILDSHGILIVPAEVPTINNLCRLELSFSHLSPRGVIPDGPLDVDVLDRLILHTDKNSADPAVAEGGVRMARGDTLESGV